MDTLVERQLDSGSFKEFNSAGVVVHSFKTPNSKEARLFMASFLPEKENLLFLTERIMRMYVTECILNIFK
jgi:hypothetical protein